MYLLLDSTTNIVQWAGESMPTTISPHVVATVADTDPNAQGATVRPTDYIFTGGALTRRSYFTLAYDGKTITATLMDAPATFPTSVTLTVAGQAITTTPTSSTVTNPDGSTSTVVTAAAYVAVHPTLSQYQIEATVSATGFVDTTY